MRPVPLEWLVAVADLRLYLAQRRFGRALDELVRKYRPDQPRAPKGTPEGGQWVVDAGYVLPRRFKNPGQRLMVAWMPMGFTKHGINQAINRGVSASDINSALNNPTKVVPGSTPHSWKYYGINAVVVLNPFGEIVTLWPR